MIKKNELVKRIETLRLRSAWLCGVRDYALEMLEGFEAEEVGGPFEMLENEFLNGAENWKAYSWGGCSLIYDQNIAQRLCTPSELKKTKNGTRKPNKTEEWLDTQARALYQAFRMIYRAIY